MDSYRATFTVKRLWQILAISLLLSFSTLLFFGSKIYQQVPPIPNAFQTPNGEVIYSREDIETGQNIWQSIGGMEQGSIWGHGSYLAPDWTADWLHREAESLLTIISHKQKLPASVSAEQNMEMHQVALRHMMRKNTYDNTSGKVVINTERALAINIVEQHVIKLFTGKGDKYLTLRKEYAFPLNAVLDAHRAKQLAAFFFWTSWAAVTNRPDDNVSYTSNWPHEPLVGNTPPPSVLLWSLISIFILLAGVGAIVWYYAKQFDGWREDQAPEIGFAKKDIVGSATITPSMRATAKYFWVVTALIIAQVLLGIVTAHYAVEGQGLYGLPLVDYLPYAITRTWHTQLAILWIATSWLATGLYVSPMISGYEPKFQRFGVNFLFFSLLIIVVGSFVGQWLAIHGFINNLKMNFWFGHQGYEYIDLGRFWQIYLFIGLLLWVLLVLRALWPALKENSSRSLIFLVVISTVSIGLLYGAGLMWGQHTNISIMEYWRWWVVHLWVEGIFEVFATAIISTLFVRMGLLRVSVATTMILLATIIFLGGGVLGTFHHLYWSGTPISVMAIGASFSALEVVPLLVVGFEAYNQSKLEHAMEWEQNYHWPFMFFSSVLVWNLIGGKLGYLL